MRHVINKHRLLHTWISNADSYPAALELFSVEVQGFLESFKSAEFHIAEAFWFPVHFVLYNANAGDITSGEEVFDISVGSVEGQVA